MSINDLGLLRYIYKHKIEIEGFEDLEGKKKKSEKQKKLQSEEEEENKGGFKIQRIKMGSASMSAWFFQSNGGRNNNATHT